MLTQPAIPAGPQTTAPGAQTGPEARPLSAAAGEIAGSAMRAQTPQSVDPARQSDPANRLPPEQRGPRADLLPPDPNAPTGPPPAFEASLLEQQRASFPAQSGEVKATPNALDAVDAEAKRATGAVPPSTEVRAEVPPTPAEKAEATVAAVRRMETPYDSATVDVTR